MCVKGSNEYMKDYDKKALPIESIEIYGWTMSQNLSPAALTGFKIYFRFHRKLQ